MRTNTENINQSETMTDLIEVVHSEEDGDSDEDEDELLNQFKEAMDAFKEKS